METRLLWLLPFRVIEFRALNFEIAFPLRKSHQWEYHFPVFNPNLKTTGEYMPRPWDVLASRYLAHFRIFDLREDICLSPRTGQEYPAFVLETRDWINIVPVTADGKVVMVKQYRFGSREVSLEIPGGLSDATDASMLEGARRELREETGYDSDDVIPLGMVRPNPAIMNNLCHVFYARNAEPRCETCWDIGEDLDIELIPLEEIPRLIAQGVINHSIVMNAFYLLDLYRSRPDDFCVVEQ